jgi:hypothetical protein
MTPARGDARRVPAWLARGVTLAGVALLALFVVKGLNGCGSPGGVASNDGAGGRGSAAVVLNCDPAKQTGCAAGEKCDLLCKDGRAQFACRKDEGALTVGATCKPSAAGRETCPRGTTCFASSRGSTCTQLCDATVACAAGSCQGVQALIGCSADPAANKPFALSVCQ